MTNGTFDSNTKGWTQYVSILKHYGTDYDTIGRTNVALDSASTTFNVKLYQDLDTTLSSGKTYKNSFDYYISSSNTYTDGIQCLLYGTLGEIVGDAA